MLEEIINNIPSNSNMEFLKKLALPYNNSLSTKQSGTCSNFSPDRKVYCTKNQGSFVRTETTY